MAVEVDEAGHVPECSQREGHARSRRGGMVVP
jgi:hypothetical protein